MVASKDLNQHLSSRPRSEPGETRHLHFGVFDLDLEDRELRKRGIRVQLQQKPFHILCLLLAKPGEFVTRQQLARHLWPDSHVSFDRSLNTAVNLLRRALGDSPQNPRFIETRTGLGYRFVAPVEHIGEHPVAPPASEPAKRGNERLAYAGSFDAYQDYLKGRYFQNKLTEDDLRKSEAYFESALAVDPQCAPAYAGLADTYSLFAFLDVLPAREAHRRAQEFALAALRIDQRLAESHVALGNVKKLYEWDWAGAEACYRTALELNPQCAGAHQEYAALLAAFGRHREALEEIRRAHEMDPLSLVINNDLAWTLYMARDFQGALEQAWRTLAMEAKFAPAQHTLGLAYQQLGMHEEALVELENARVCSGDHPAALASLGHAYASLGNRAEADTLLHALERLSEHRYRAPYWVALLHAGLGQPREAVRWLERACEDRDVWLVWLAVEPRFDPLRADACFQKLLGSIGLGSGR